MSSICHDGQTVGKIASCPHKEKKTGEKESAGKIQEKAESQKDRAEREQRERESRESRERREREKEREKVHIKMVY